MSGVSDPPLQGKEEGREGKQQPVQGEQRGKADPKMNFRREYSSGGQDGLELESAASRKGVTLVIPFLKIKMQDPLPLLSSNYTY